MVPTMASPRWMPMPMSRPHGGSRMDSVSKLSSALDMARAVSTARMALSGQLLGAPNTARIASPMNLSTMPPCSAMISHIVSR